MPTRPGPAVPPAALAQPTAAPTAATTAPSSAPSAAPPAAPPATQASAHPPASPPARPLAEPGAAPHPAPVTGLAILLWAADPDAPQRLVTPFFHAAAAAAMDLQVELYFSAGSVRLLAPGVAAGLRADPAHPKTVLDALREAVAHGARCWACHDALAAHGLAQQPLIPECQGRAGAVAFIGRVADPAWRTLVF